MNLLYNIFWVLKSDSNWTIFLWWGELIINFDFKIIYDIVVLHGNSTKFPFSLAKGIASEHTEVASLSDSAGRKVGSIQYDILPLNYIISTF